MPHPNDWEPKVGQKIIALVDGDALPKPIVKGDVFTVLAVMKICCNWHVDIGITSAITENFTCRYHKNVPFNLEKGKPFYPQACVFAPYNPYSNSVSKELAEKAMNVGDGADQPIKIKEPALS